MGLGSEYTIVEQISRGQKGAEEEEEEEAVGAEYCRIQTKGLLFLIIIRKMI